MRLTVQLYTVRDQIAEDLRGTLAKIREIGLEYVEGAGSFGGSPEEDRRMLDDLGLKVSGAHVPLDQLEGDLSKVVDQMKGLGAPYVIVPWIGEEVRAQGYAALARRLEPIGRQLKSQGLALAYHNHDFEFQAEGDKTGLETLYDTAAPEVLEAELDLAWVKIGGGDPVEWINRMGSRAALVHLKDYDPAQTPQWRPAGQGVMDWDACLKACDQAGVQYGGIELDQSPGDPLDAVRESYEFFAGKGLR